MEATLAHCPEARRATHDGYIWPVRRASMQNSDAIIERMAEDIENTARHCGMDGTVTVDDLVDKGWLRAQIGRHGNNAARRAREASRHEAA